jgi:hypothetical protein
MLKDFHIARWMLMKSLVMAFGMLLAVTFVTGGYQVSAQNETRILTLNNITDVLNGIIATGICDQST